MKFIFENWHFFVTVAVAILAVITMVISFFKSGKEQQINKVREWLLYAVTLAEKELGSGTGELKLRFVYDLFATKFSWLVKLISFERFSELVDEALEDMRYLIDTNISVNCFVNGTDEKVIKLEGETNNEGNESI